MSKKVVSTRMLPDELAKARDGLIEKGIEPAHVNNISQILKLTFYYGLLALCDEPKAPASEESLMFIKARLGQPKSGGPITLDELIHTDN